MGDGRLYYKILLIAFGRDGIYVQFPYLLGEESGIVARLDFADTGSIARQWNLQDVGHITAHRTKFAHHVDGEAHFSQDGKVRTIVRRTSFRLDGPIGHLFQMSAFHLNGFTELTARDHRKRSLVKYTFPNGLPEAVNVVAEWWRLSTIQRRVHPSAVEVGPLLKFWTVATNTYEDLTLIGGPPPFKSPFDDRAILLGCHSTERPASVDHSMFCFVGGWDLHEVPSGSGQKVHHTGALLATYPCANVEEARAVMPTIDLNSRGH